MDVTVSTICAIKVGFWPISSLFGGGGDFGLLQAYFGGFGLDFGLIWAYFGRFGLDFGLIRAYFKPIWGIWAGFHLIWAYFGTI